MQFDQGVTLAGTVHQTGANAETYLQSFNPATGQFEAAIAKNVTLNRAGIVRSSILGVNFPGLEPAEIRQMDISSSTIVGNTFIGGIWGGGTATINGRMERCFVEGAYKPHLVRTSHEIIHWQRQVVAYGDKTSTRAVEEGGTVSALSEQIFLNNLAGLVDFDPDDENRPHNAGNATKAANMLSGYCRTKGLNPMELAAKLGLSHAGYYLMLDRLRQIHGVLGQPD